MLDVSTLVRWAGPPVGIVRVEHALAMAARQRGDTVLMAENRATGVLHELAPCWADTVLGWSGVVDRHEARGPLRGLFSRQGIVMALERIRLNTPWMAYAADRLQRAVLAIREHRFPLYDGDGARIANVPVDMALAGPQRLGPGDTLFLAGSGWSSARVSRIGNQQGRDGFAIAAICYDLIPITHPQFYTPEDRQEFAAHWRAMLPLLSQLLVTSPIIGRDVAAWARREGLVMPPMAVVTLGFDPPARAKPAELPEGLRQGGFSLFVSTIEPRKGHAVLLAAWDMLLAQGLPQRLGFKLVLVGRPGWMVEPVLERLARGVDGVVHLPAASDAVVAALYQGAAFCCYPSQYEGFGLPILEAFARGRAVLASDGGALAETGAGLACALDPLDIPAWAAALAAWIEHPEARLPYEARITAHFRQPVWGDAASRILDLLSVAPVSGDFRWAAARLEGSPADGAPAVFEE